MNQNSQSLTRIVEIEDSPYVEKLVINNNNQRMLGTLSEMGFEPSESFEIPEDTRIRIQELNQSEEYRGKQPKSQIISNIYDFLTYTLGDNMIAKATISALRMNHLGGSPRTQVWDPQYGGKNNEI